MRELPDQWANKELVNKLQRKSDVLKICKEKIALEENLADSEIFQENINSIAITELLSFDFCYLSGRKDILEISPPLQAFITYASHIYDCIEDKHEEKFGESTILKKHGEKKSIQEKEAYEKIITKLSKKLENANILSAHKFALIQYYKILKTDKHRNSKVLCLPEAIKLHEIIAGEHGKINAYLSGGNDKIQKLAFHISNALMSMDDILDFYSGEDLNGHKTTIPTSIYYSNVNEDNVNDIKYKQEVIKKSLKYTFGQLKETKSIIEQISIKEQNIIIKLYSELNEFAKSIK